MAESWGKGEKGRGDWLKEGQRGRLGPEWEGALCNHTYASDLWTILNQKQAEIFRKANSKEVWRSTAREGLQKSEVALPPQAHGTVQETGRRDDRYFW